MSDYPYSFGDPCLPTRVQAAPSGPQWLHEIKHDGYRLMVRRTPHGIRVRTRNGFDWTDRYPLIVEAAERLAATSFVIDGDGVILVADGVSDFDRLHSPPRRRGAPARLRPAGVESHRPAPRAMDNREITLASLLHRSHAGIQLIEHIEADHGSTVFDHACHLRLEGIVSKRDAPYRSERSGTCLKVKNRAPGNVPRRGGSVLVTPADAHFEIKVDGLVRTHRAFRETAIMAARLLRQRNPGAAILVTDLRDGSSVSFDRLS
jgi:bifunctional non-homologous end joining protein LigD